MKKILNYISLVLLGVIIIGLFLYNPYYRTFETQINSNKCAFAGGEYYYISGYKLFRENGNEPLAESIDGVVPFGDNLLIYDYDTAWIYDTVKGEQRLLWETPTFAEPVVCDYISEEAFVFYEYKDDAYIVRAATGEVFSGKEGETTEKDGFLYNFSWPCGVTSPDGTWRGLYRRVFINDITVYISIIDRQAFFETPENGLDFFSIDDYSFSGANVFFDDEKVFVLAQHDDKNKKKTDELFVLNPETRKFEKTGRKIDGRMVTLIDGSPVLFKEGKFFYEGKEISRMPMKTRGVKTVPCGNRIFVFNGDDNFVYAFDVK